MNILSILLKLLKSSTVSTTKSFPEIIESFKDHQPKIEEIFCLRWEEFQFKFHSVSESEVRKVLLKIDEKKADLTGDILAGIRKVYVDSCISILTEILDASSKRSCFKNQLKLVEETLVFNKRGACQTEYV